MRTGARFGAKRIKLDDRIEHDNIIRKMVGAARKRRNRKFV